MDLATNKSAVLLGELNLRNNLFSVFQEAHDSGLISESEIQNIQIRMLDILKDLIIIYTSNQSSSVKEETAQSLMQSIIYCLDFYCMKMDNPDSLIQNLKSAGIKEVYKEGLKLLYAYVEETKKLFMRVKNQRLTTNLVAYNSSIDEAIPDFFSHYDVRLSAHDTAAGIDYPLMFDDISIKGILYIRQYLEKLALENAFCRQFAPKDIEYLLKNYGRTYRIRYQDYLLNICEIVLTNAIFSVMLGNSALKLNISRTDYALLEEKLRLAARDDIPSMIRQAVNRMLAELNMTEVGIADYIHKYESELLARLNNALQYGTLDRLVITVAGTSESDQTTFDPGQKMDNDKFRRLVERVLNCTEPTEKAGIILTNISSLIDFIDVLKADCLFGDDYMALFRQLGDLEISVLAGTVFSEELRTASLYDAAWGYSEGHIDWKNHLAMFLQSLSPDRLKTIASLI